MMLAGQRVTHGARLRVRWPDGSEEEVAVRVEEREEDTRLGFITRDVVQVPLTAKGRTWYFRVPRSGLLFEWVTPPGQAAEAAPAAEASAGATPAVPAHADGSPVEPQVPAPAATVPCPACGAAVAPGQACAVCAGEHLEECRRCEGAILPTMPAELREARICSEECLSRAAIYCRACSNPVPLEAPRAARVARICSDACRVRWNDGRHAGARIDPIAWPEPAAG
jgi:hypothetical protein